MARLTRGYIVISIKLRVSLLLSVSMTALLLEAPVAAQTTPEVEATAQASDQPAPAAKPGTKVKADQTAAQEGQTIVVTGSRIARPEFSRPNPIQSFTAESIKEVGATNITDFLVRSPALLGSTTSLSTAGSNLTRS